MRVDVGAQYGRRAVHPKLRMAPGVTLVGVGALQEIGPPELASQRHEAVVVGAHHYHVDVVVPRYVAFLAHSAQQAAAVNPYLEAVAGAHLEQLAHELHLHLPHFLHPNSNHVTSA